MLLSCNKMIFDKIFDIKAADMEPVCRVYNVSLDELKSMIWEKFDILGMEVRIANTALDWLIDCCEAEQELYKTLRGEIRQVILHAAIFYTNVASNAVSDRD